MDNTNANFTLGQVIAQLVANKKEGQKATIMVERVLSNTDCIIINMAEVDLSFITITSTSNIITICLVKPYNYNTGIEASREVNFIKIQRVSGYLRFSKNISIKFTHNIVEKDIFLSVNFMKWVFSVASTEPLAPVSAGCNALFSDMTIEAVTSPNKTTLPFYLSGFMNAPCFEQFSLTNITGINLLSLYNLIAKTNTSIGNTQITFLNCTAKQINYT